MSKIVIKCNTCEAMFDVGHIPSGQAVKCPQCGNNLSIPGQEKETTAATPASRPRMRRVATEEATRRGRLGEPPSVRRQRAVPPQQSKSNLIAILVAAVVLASVVAYFVFTQPKNSETAKVPPPSGEPVSRSETKTAPKTVTPPPPAAPSSEKKKNGTATRAPAGVDASRGVRSARSFTEMTDTLRRGGEGRDRTITEMGRDKKYYVSELIKALETEDVVAGRAYANALNELTGANIPVPRAPEYGDGGGLMQKWEEWLSANGENIQ